MLRKEDRWSEVNLK